MAEANCTSAFDVSPVEAVFEDSTPEMRHIFQRVGGAIKARKMRQRCAEYKLSQKRQLAGLDPAGPKRKSAKGKGQGRG